MKKSNKLQLNLILQSFYQVLIVLTPLITSPYISRILGSNGLGVYSYTYSVSNYFAIFAMLGTIIYGSKAIAKVRDNREENDKVYSEILALQLLLATVGSLLYFILIMSVKQENITVSLIQVFMVIACAFNVGWFFFGIEEFRVTVARNVVIKILQIACIFLFVKQRSDLAKYVFIMAFGEFASQLSLFVVARKYVKFRKPTLKGILRHLRPNLLLFIPGIAFAINQNLDKTMIGLFSSYTNTGFYYNAEKLIKIPTGLITGIGVVMLPYVTNSIAVGAAKNSSLFIKKSIYPMAFLVTALSAGITSISEEFVPVFFGDGFEPCVELIKIMALTMIFKAISDVIRTQYLIPNDREKDYSKAVIVGAGINLVLNLLMIKPFGALGATCATLISEVLVFVIYNIVIWKETRLMLDIGKCLIFVVPAVFMFMGVRYVAMFNFNILVKLVVEIFVGGIVYIVLGAPCMYAVDKNGTRSFVVNIANKLANRRKGNKS